MAEVILSLVFGILAIICLIYGIRTWNFKGPILMNKYVLASDEEKLALGRQSEKEKHEDYRFVSKLSFAISFIWITVILGVAIHSYFFWVTLFCSLALVIYAIVVSFKYG